MIIFLRRIPANTKHVEIADFVTPVLSNGLFKKPGRILNIETLTLRDSRLNSVEYHCLVTLDSEWAAKQAVKGLKNRRLNGRFVLVRPYYHRNSDNDKRRISDKKTLKGFIEKRNGDRRRGQFLEIITNGSKSFKPEEQLPEAVTHQYVQVTFVVPVAVELKLAECFVKFELENINSSLKQDEKEAYRITPFLTELDGPQNKSRRFQLFLAKPILTELLIRIKKEFSSNEIYYWITPVIDYGTI